jgi:hypothetical protein
MCSSSKMKNAKKKLKSVKLKGIESKPLSFGVALTVSHPKPKGIESKPLSFGVALAHPKPKGFDSIPLSFGVALAHPKPKGIVGIKTRIDKPNPKLNIALSYR